MVVLNYHLYKSILLTLPFSKIEQYGVLLSLFNQYCIEELKKEQDQKPSKLSPQELVENFFKNNFTKTQNTFSEKFSILFKFIQFIERQVTIFDSLEDVYFEELNEMGGEGTLDYFLSQVNAQWKYKLLANKIHDYRIHIVLTAHPTQFYSVHLLGLLRRLTRAIKKKDTIAINKIFHQLGKTNFYSRSRVTPIEEAKSILVYLRTVFYKNIPFIIKKMEQEIKHRLPDEKRELPSFITIGFWPGGDRDGNPNVTADTTRAVAKLLKQSIISCYLKDLKLLQKVFTFKGLYDNLRKIKQRLRQTVVGHLEGYSSFTSFSNDLADLRNLIINEHEGIFVEDLDAFIQKTKCFGFYFASLDIRQDSNVYEKVIGNLLSIMGGGSYQTASSKARLDFLLNLSSNETSKTSKTSHSKTIQKQKLSAISINELWNHPKLTSETVEVLNTAKTSLVVQQQNGIEGLYRYIISNTKSLFSVLEVGYILQLVSGKPYGEIDFDIIPLFETMNDLADAGKTMDSLYKVVEYRKQIKYRSERQVVMLGFSDGTKDGGYISANWAIKKAKEDITAVSIKHGVKVIFFDGRGGPPARGGGDTNKFYASLGDQVANHEIQLTIQGQTISSKYGTDESFRFNVEQLLVAGLESHIFKYEQNSLNAEQRKVLNELARESYECYRKLKTHPHFLTYMGEVTPLPFYGDANIGSRPSKRVKGGSLALENLRAIPFVSSWSQMKHNIPAYYGLGTAFQNFINKNGTEKILRLYRKSAFFRTLLNNSVQALAKTNLRYTAHLAKLPKVGEVWELINRETTLAREMLAKVMQQPGLFKPTENNLFSVNFREEIVVPLVIIQQYALTLLWQNKNGKIKLTEKQIEVVKKVIIRSMPGLINAGRNSA